MLDERLFARYQLLRERASDPDAWIETREGSDLWVDGVNVFLTVDSDDFQAGLELYYQTETFDSDSVTSLLQALHRFCSQAAKRGEFELYQALCVGMTALSLHPEINGQLFNLPAQVTNHSLALLLSPTYHTIWIHSYNAGIELVLDLEKEEYQIFRPEHGRIYQKAMRLEQGTFLKFPFHTYFHEIAHILLFHDLYPRVLGTPEEEWSIWAHLEASISCLEEIVLAEIMSMQEDLSILLDGYSMSAMYQEYGDYRFQVLRGQSPAGVTGRDLALYRKRWIQQGQGEAAVPDNKVKRAILAAHPVAQEREIEIARSFSAYIQNQQQHTFWGQAASRRNRVSAFREVIDLLPSDPFCQQKYAESLDPDAWRSPGSVIAGSPPALCTATRQRNRQIFEWRELICRIAELRGFLQQEHAEQEALDALLAIAQRSASALTGSEPDDLHELRDAALHCLAAVSNQPVRERAARLLQNQFTHLLEPH
ncbi:hypothetical protein [Tumebacillus lipolyticus]|uniref:Uncharacterized protein n=1 Tax=Tumebacillus lipolyticus TaxID=1280370 RepID=A0ABW5A030_9BACL